MLSKDKKFMFTLSLPFIVMLFSAIILSFVKFRPGLPVSETRPQAPLYGEVSALKRTPVLAASLRSPIQIPAASSKKGFPGTALSEIAPPQAPAEERKVSLVLVNGNRKMAIINGIVVREGDITGNSRVIKIEKNRVLLKDKLREEWVKLEQ